jgi:DNA-binding transcriptional ArsR family regulator
MPTLTDKQLVDALKAIADPTRLKILRLLKQ